MQVIGGGTISADRCHKQSRWEQSDRLKQGTIVALATHRDLMSAVRAGLAYMTVAKAYGLPGMSQTPFCNDISITSNKNEKATLHLHSRWLTRRSELGS